MNAENVFAAPQAPVRDVKIGNGLMTEAVITSLSKTRPWVLLVAVLGLICAFIVAIAALPMLLGGAGLEEELAASNPIFGGGVMMGMGVFYLLLAVITVFASLHLLRFAGSIRKALDTLEHQSVEEALKHQASFWRLVGMLTLVSLVLFFGLLVAAVVLAV